MASSSSNSNSSATSRKRQRREVISEEAYQSTMSQIIQRDYYSDLPDLQLKVAVINKREQGDFAGAVRLRRAARKLANHEEALVGLEEQDDSATVEGVRATARPLARESLTGFHARITSEDNAEFAQTQSQEVKANRERLEELFLPSHEKLALLKATAENNDQATYNDHALASDEFNPPAPRIEWKPPPARNGIFFVPTPQLAGQKQEVLLLQNDSSKATEDNNAETNDNDNQRALMPPPPAKKSVTTTAAKRDLVEYIPKRSLEKRIEPSQTRFPKTLVVRPPTTLTTATEDYTTDASTDLDSFAGDDAAKPLHQLRQERAARQKQEQESFVNMTPLVVPQEGGEASPIITWGNVASTPLLIRPVNENTSNDSTADNHSSSTKSFTVADESDQDRAAQAAMKHIEQRKAKAQSASTSSKKRKATPLLFHNNHGSQQRDIASFSPAAMSLLAKTTSSQHRHSSSARAGSALASALRPNYTPQRMGGSSRLRNSSARVDGSSSRSRKGDVAFNSTPKLQGRGATSKSNGNASTLSSTVAKRTNLTDGLLNLP